MDAKSNDGQGNSTAFDRQIELFLSMSSFSLCYQLDEMNSMQVLLLKIQPGQIAAFEGKVSSFKSLGPTSASNILQGLKILLMWLKKTPQGSK